VSGLDKRTRIEQQIAQATDLRLLKLLNLAWWKEYFREMSEDFECQDCFRVGPLSKHGRCDGCGSDAVITEAKLRPARVSAALAPQGCCANEPILSQSLSQRS
jgi:hypothetical protein